MNADFEDPVISMSTPGFKFLSPSEAIIIVNFNINRINSQTIRLIHSFVLKSSSFEINIHIELDSSMSTGVSLLLYNQVMKIILFDIDATLLNCGKEINDKCSEMMFKTVFNINASEDDINHSGKTAKGVIEEVIRFVKKLNDNQEIEIPNRAYQVWADSLKELIKDSPPQILPGIRDLLENLSKNKNFVLGLLTGNSRIQSKVKLTSVGLDHFFLNDEGVLLGAFGDISSERSDLILEAKEKFGEGTYIIIDDSIVGGKMAKEKNILSILMATGNASVEELKQYSNYVFQDFGDNRLQEVINIINTISG